jgi:hypothetical protein
LIPFLGEKQANLRLKDQKSPIYTVEIANKRSVSLRTLMSTLSGSQISVTNYFVRERQFYAATLIPPIKDG